MKGDEERKAGMYNPEFIIYIIYTLDCTYDIDIQTSIFSRRVRNNMYLHIICIAFIRIRDLIQKCVRSEHNRIKKKNIMQKETKRHNLYVA